MPTSKEIRKAFLDDSQEVLKELRCRMLGKVGDHPGADTNLMLKYYDVVSDIIRQADDQQRINTKNTSDILTLLKRGKVSITEAKELMQILMYESEVEMNIAEAKAGEVLTNQIKKDM